MKVPQDAPTIQAAIDAAQPEDTIEISPGEYEESIAIQKPVTVQGGKGVVLRSPVAVDPVISVDAKAVCVRDIRICGGIAGVLAQGGAETRIENCVLEQNESGVLAWDDASVTLSDCAISENEWSGLRATDRASISATECSIARSAVGVQSDESASLVLTRCSVTENRLGIHARGSTHLVLGECSVTKNLEAKGIARMEDLFGWFAIHAGLPATKEEHHRLRELELKREALEMGGIRIEESAVAEIGETTISSQLIGVYVIGARVSLTRCTVHDHGSSGLSGAYGLFLKAGGSVLVQGCRFYANAVGARAAAEEGDESSSLEVVGSVLSENAQGLVAEAGTQVSVQDTKFTQNGYGCRLRACRADLRDNLFRGNVDAIVGRRAEITGDGNVMEENGCDLRGDLPGMLRKPIRSDQLSEVRLPSPEFSTLQEAIDALREDGTLIVTGGQYSAGVTISKNISIRTEDVHSEYTKTRWLPQPGWMYRSKPAFLRAKIAGINEFPDSAILLSVLPGSTVSIERIEFLGSVELSGNARGSFKNCAFRGVGRHTIGLLAYDSSTVDMSLCHAIGCSVGTLVAHSARATAKYCWWEYCRDEGVLVVDEASAYLDGCHFRGNRISVASGRETQDRPQVTGCKNHFESPDEPRLFGYITDIRMKHTEPARDSITLPYDDYKSIDEALGDLLPGGVLHLTAGHYVSSQLIVGQAVTIRCEDEGQATVLAKLRVFSGGSLRAHGVTFRAPLIGQGDGEIHLTKCRLLGGLGLYDSAEGKLEDCTIAAVQGWPSTNLDLHGFATVELVDCRISGATHGVYAHDRTSLQLKRSEVLDHRVGKGLHIIETHQQAIYLEPGTTAVIEDCLIHDNGVCGIHATPPLELCVRRTEITGHEKGLEIVGWTQGIPRFALSGEANHIHGNLKDFIPDTSEAEWPNGFAGS